MSVTSVEWRRPLWKRRSRDTEEGKQSRERRFLPPSYMSSFFSSTRTHTRTCRLRARLFQIIYRCVYTIEYFPYSKPEGLQFDRPRFATTTTTTTTWFNVIHSFLMTHRVINYNNDPKCNQTILANPMTRDLWKLIVGTANATSNNSSMIIDDISRNEFLHSN